jgi:hypothetical protein
MAPTKKFMKENSVYLDYPPQKVEAGLDIWSRPNLDILLKSVFLERKQFFDVGVWACATKENTALGINKFFRKS